jgi:Uma2 family endonuclease
MATTTETTADLANFLPLHRFSNADYLRMIERGVLGRGDRVELMNGLIVEKSESEIPPHRFSTAKYLEMIDNGIIGPDDRVELVKGMIVDMSPAGSRHGQFLGQLSRIIAPLFSRFEIWVQGTLVLADGNVYDPDLMLLRQKPGGYKLKLPTAEDVRLIVEAADSSFRRDKLVKLPVYAEAEIEEFWIADLEREVLLIHRDPQAGAYESVETRRGDDIVSPLPAPEF